MKPDNIRERVEELIKDLAGLIQQRTMYGPGHKITRKTLDDLYDNVTGVLQDRGEVTIGVVGREIAFEKEPFYETSRHVRGFIEHLREIEIEKITFYSGLAKKDLADLSGVICRSRKILDGEGGFQKAFDSAGITHISIGKLSVDAAEEKGPELSAGENYQKGIDFLTESAGRMNSGQPLDTEVARRLVGGIITDLVKNKDLLLILTSTRSHDESMFVHDVNVAIFTLLQAEVLGLEKLYLTDIGVAALLHDIGKLSVPGDVLRKEGRYSEDEKKMMSEYPVKGAKILLETPGLGVLPAITAFEHHIFFDSTGYPEKYCAGGNNFVSMMITISAFYDNLRSKRSYRECIAAEKTYEEMTRLSGSYFHPDILKHFFSIIGVYPPGTLVELDTGEIGIVIRESVFDNARPQVEVLYDSRGEKDEELRMVNLLEKDRRGRYRQSIVRSIAPSDRYEIPEKYF